MQRAGLITKIPRELITEDDYSYIADIFDPPPPISSSKRAENISYNWIPHLRGLYLVTALGELYHYHHFINSKWRGNHLEKEPIEYGQYVSLYEQSMCYGHAGVGYVLNTDSQRRHKHNFFVPACVLVLEALVGPPAGDQTYPIFLDANHGHPFLSNLKWGTIEEYEENLLELQKTRSRIQNIKKSNIIAKNLHYAVKRRKQQESENDHQP